MSNERNFSIGQIIYVLSSNAQEIIPAIVVEEMIVKKLDGQQVSWKIAIGPKGKEKIVDSNKLKGEIYTDLNEIRAILEKRLQTFLTSILQKAEARTMKWYGKANTNSSLIDDSEEKIDPEQLANSFDEQPNFSQPVSNINNSLAPTKEALREELKRRMMSDEDDEMPHTTTQQASQEASLIQMPDGSFVKAKIKT